MKRKSLKEPQEPIERIEAKVDKMATLLEDLASTTKRGFDDVENTFNNRFDKVDTKLAHINDRLDRVENVRLAGLDNRLKRAEDHIRQLKTKVGLR